MKTTPKTLALMLALVASAFSQSTDKDTTNTHGERVDTATERLAFQTAIGTNFQVKSASFTAEKNGRYLVTGSATVTDPGSPATGDTYWVHVRSGTATVGGVGYSVGNTFIRRVYFSGAWTSDVRLPDASKPVSTAQQTALDGKLSLGAVDAADLDYVNSTEIGAALADADEVMVSDGGGNTTRRKTLVSRIWTYILGKIQTTAANLTALWDFDFITFADQVTTNAESGVNVGMVNQISPHPSRVVTYTAQSSNPTTPVGTGSSTARTTAPKSSMEWTIPAAGDATGWQMDSMFCGWTSGSGSRFGSTDFQFSWSYGENGFSIFETDEDYSHFVGMGVVAGKQTAITGTDYGIQLQVTGVASTSRTAKFNYGNGTAVTSSASVDLTALGTGWLPSASLHTAYRITYDYSTRAIAWQYRRQNVNSWTTILSGTVPADVAITMPAANRYLIMSWESTAAGVPMGVPSEILIAQTIYHEKP